MKVRKLLAVAASALASLTACQGAPKTLPPPPRIIDLTMREYRFSFKAPSGKGRVLFQIHNAGKLAHRVALFPLPDDFPSLKEQVKNPVKRSTYTQASTPDIFPGDRGSFAVDLHRGRYGMICFLIDNDGVSHATKGMASEFRVL